jgi:hypothetical protein
MDILVRLQPSQRIILRGCPPPLQEVASPKMQKYLFRFPHFRRGYHDAKELFPGSSSSFSSGSISVPLLISFGDEAFLQIFHKSSNILLEFFVLQLFVLFPLPIFRFSYHFFFLRTENVS